MISKLSSPSRIQVLLIHGFLGAGKTTFMKRLISHYENFQIGIIENEVGDTSIDSTLLENPEIELQEVNNGAIFCSCQHHNFIAALELLSKKSLDLLLIEASGISDPSPMVSDLRFVNSKVQGIYEYMGSVCLLNAENILDLILAVTVIPKQINHGSLIMVNKIDLISSDPASYLEKIDQTIRKYNPHAPILHTSFAEIDFPMFLDLMQDPFIQSAGLSLNTPANQPLKCVFTLRKEIPYDFLSEFLQHISPLTYRIKGFCYCITVLHQIKEFYVSTVGSQIFIDPWLHPLKETKLVFIYPPLNPIKQMVKDALQPYITE